MTGIFEDLQNAVFVFRRDALKRRQKHVVFFTHQVERGHWNLFLLKVIEERIHFVSQLEPADEFFLTKLLRFIDKENS